MCIQLARLELDVAFQKQLLQQRRAAPRGAPVATTAVNPTVSYLQIPPPPLPSPLPPPPQALPLHHERPPLATTQLTKAQQNDLNNGATTNGGSMPLRQPGASMSSAASGSFSTGSTGGSGLSLTREPQFAWRPAVWLCRFTMIAIISLENTFRLFRANNQSVI